MVRPTRICSLCVYYLYTYGWAFLVCKHTRRSGSCTPCTPCFVLMRRSVCIFFVPCWNRCTCTSPIHLIVLRAPSCFLLVRLCPFSLHASSGLCAVWLLYSIIMHRYLWVISFLRYRSLTRCVMARNGTGSPPTFSYRLPCGSSLFPVLLMGSFRITSHVARTDGRRVPRGSRH